MKRYRAWLAHALLASLLTFAAGVARAQDPVNIAGLWTGTLNVGGSELHVYFTFARDSAGKLTGSLVSPDQSSTSFDLVVVTLSGATLHCEVSSIAAVFDGTVSADGSSITGSFTQAGMTLPLVLTPTNSIAKPPRPQEPLPPFPYNVEEVTYSNAAAGVTFSGTLTKPRTQGPYPAVLLITGSGAQNRDEELLGHKPFLLLADTFTRRGLAVLRVDDRGVGGSSAGAPGATTHDFVGDALAGVAYLKQRSDIDPHRIGLLGHSEGGLIAPAAAVSSNDVAFVVMLAGPGVPGAELIKRQVALINEADDTTPAELKPHLIALSQAFIDITVRESDDAHAQTQMTELWQTTKMSLLASDLSPELKAEVEQADASIQAQIQSMLDPWMRYFLTYDPAPALRQVRCPVLALNGSRDLQVDAKQNLPPIAAALRAARNHDFSVEALPKLNHLFQTAKTGSPSEYAKIEETFNPRALRRIADWLVQRTHLQ